MADLSFDEMFDLFWSEYPRHEAKKDAKKAFMRVGWSEKSFSTVLECLKDQKRFLWPERAVRYIPLAASWIRGERWEDEIPDWEPVVKDPDSEAMRFPGGRDRAVWDELARRQ